MDTAQYMGNLTTPLALIFIGVTLYSMGLKKIRFDLGLIGICLGRFIIAPLSMYLLSFIFPMPELMFKSICNHGVITGDDSNSSTI